MSRRPKPNSIVGQFIARPVEMLKSPAWKALPDPARRILEVIELEHAAHGAADNGRLEVPYNDFEKNGVRRQTVSLSLRQCQELGFLEVMQQGRIARGVHKQASVYRVTYLNGRSTSAQPTHDWRDLDTEEKVARALSRAAASKSAEHVRRAKKARLALTRGEQRAA
jgi:DNA-binding transcriptional ArsR family regulator